MRWVWPLLLLAACGSSDRRTVTVLAASSLTGSFTALERMFEQTHPDIDVVLSFAGSQTLAMQVRHGIVADVFASADERHAESLFHERLVTAPRVFAEGELVVVGTPTRLEELSSVRNLVLGAPEVPVGRYSDLLLDRASDRFGAQWRRQVDSRVVSREPSVRMVAAKVALGEADAGVVYRADLEALPGIGAVSVPEDWVPPIRYVQVRLARAPEASLAEEWMAFVESPRGRLELTRRGFR